MRTYVINLDRHRERWARVSASFEAQGIDVERVSAVDAEALGTAHFASWMPRRVKYVLSNAEIACTLSHRNVWAQFVDGGDDFCAVFEDDIEFGGALREFLGGTGWIPADADIVKLETFNFATFARDAGIEAFGRRLSLLGSAHFGTAGYIIRRAAAQRLLDLTRAIDRTTDDIMFDVRAIHFNGLRTYQVEPALCIQFSRLHEDEPIDYLKSSIIPKRWLIARGGSSRLLRELVRPFKRLGTSIFIRAPLRLAGFRKKIVAYRQ